MIPAHWRPVSQPAMPPLPPPVEPLPAPLYPARTPAQTALECRVGCGACCIAPSISSPIPGMPHGKPAGVRCVQLTADNRCALFGLPERPAVCTHLRAMPEMCRDSAQAALIYLTELETYTAPPQN